jgi:hypothetical protein
VFELQWGRRDSVDYRDERVERMNQEFALILFQVIVLVLAFSVHESAHAYVAMRRRTCWVG